MDHSIPLLLTWSLQGAVYSMHHSPNNWPDPETFVPERFLEGSPESKSVNLEAYMPFGDVRKCCGCDL